MKERLVEVKNYPLTPLIFWNELQRFQRLDSGSPGTYCKFILASPGLSKELQSLTNGLRRIRGPYRFYDEESAIFKGSFDDFSARVEKLGGKRQDAAFLFDKVEVVTELAAHQSQGEALFKQAFIEFFSRIPGCVGAGLTRSVRQYKDLLHRRKNQTIYRKELELRLREKIPLAQLPSFRPVRLYTASGLYRMLKRRDCFSIGANLQEKQ